MIQNQIGLFFLFPYTFSSLGQTTDEVKTMELYFSLHPSWQFTGKRLILLKDIADIYCSGVLDPAPGSLPVFRLPTENMQPHYRLTAFDVACLLQRTYPKARIVSMGEKEILLS